MSLKKIASGILEGDEEIRKIFLMGRAFVVGNKKVSGNKSQ
ncbi:hypothetical protein B601_0915 [Chlamydia psittaci WS/RT/E30]|nr:hypothetical protein B601_0915 [Chlamydia psittaci WS/RT/E30]